jgi:hypothetical protein
MAEMDAVQMVIEPTAENVRTAAMAHLAEAILFAEKQLADWGEDLQVIIDDIFSGVAGRVPKALARKLDGFDQDAWEADSDDENLAEWQRVFDGEEFLILRSEGR